MVYWLNLIGVLFICLAAALNKNIVLWWLLPITWIIGTVLELWLFKDNQPAKKVLSKIIIICGTSLFLYKNPLFYGLYILIAGQILNFLVNAVNHYQMPVDIKKSGYLFLSLPRGYIAASNKTKLNFLGDFIHIPFPGAGSLASPGDLLLCLGSYMAVIELMLK